MNFPRNYHEHPEPDDTPLPRDADGRTLTGDELVAQLRGLLEGALRAPLADTPTEP